MTRGEPPRKGFPENSHWRRPLVRVRYKVATSRQLNFMYGPMSFHCNSLACRVSNCTLLCRNSPLPSSSLVLSSNQGRYLTHDMFGEVLQCLSCQIAVGLKRKVNSQREKRGGVPAKGNPGDKLFHHVDYSPGFHQNGELIVGSSFSRYSTFVTLCKYGPSDEMFPPLDPPFLAHF